MGSEMDRDTAVEEALEALSDEHRWDSPAFGPVLRLLWDRAQEAEREACCKVMCSSCRDGLALTIDPKAPTHWRWVHTATRWACVAWPIRARAPEKEAPRG